MSVTPGAGVEVRMCSYFVASLDIARLFVNDLETKRGWNRAAKVKERGVNEVEAARKLKDILLLKDWLLSERS